MVNTKKNVIDDQTMNNEQNPYMNEKKNIILYKQLAVIYAHIITLL